MKLKKIISRNKNKIKQFSIFPITKSIRYSNRLNSEVIKKQIMDRMLGEIMLATEFKIEDQGDGTNIMVGRLDTVRITEEEYDFGKERT